MAERILITGGAGFVGANLSVALAERRAGVEVIAFDNLYRRGSEMNVSRLEAAGVTFINGDVRDRDAVLAVGEITSLVECSAEPSVLAGVDGDPTYAIETNLVGAFNCLELARRHGSQVIFLSTSRVYPVASLSSLEFTDTGTRFHLNEEQPVKGASRQGISESFPTDGIRTIYGSTKLAAELLVAEYGEAYELPTTIDRCGVIAGPWQMGRVDQGVFTWWLLAHYFGRSLEYIGFGGVGHQVRDLLHVEDLIDLIGEQLSEPRKWAGTTVNVGGGLPVSLSLAETTDLCRELTGNEVPIKPAADDRPGDIPIYLTDSSRLQALTDWRPRRDAETILSDTLAWINENEVSVRDALVS
jgi:CDP-paratose 2-epimerase